MATLRKRGDRWQAQIRRNGFEPQSRSFSARIDAERWVRAIERQMDMGEVTVRTKEFDHISLEDLIRRYIREIVPLKRGHYYETVILKAFLRHPIAKKKVVTLHTSDFAAYRDERLKQIKAASLRRQLNPIQNMFEVAKHEWGFPIKANPVASLTLDRVNTPRVRRLRQSELTAIVRAGTKTVNPYLIPSILFAIETGLRRAELLSVKRTDVDLARRTVTIPQTKNGTPRIIPLTAAAIAVVHDLHSSTDRLFPISANALRLSWERLLARAKIEDLHFHDLRHEAISRFFEMGLTAPEVAMISGHKDARMLFRYAHAQQERILKQFDLASSRPNSAKGNSSPGEPQH